ncbi:hypothetical protein SAMN05660668_00814 [Pseudobutyrivibrio sp. AR14]|uniref:hypothetical protein n=1 Tax=Pseudobutyrivibrio sp. AR14 TaxID=1520804 RepID=UPI00088FB364|nr:hypothetical protein [Pseudobutyrivibrio sp. AR14]SCX92210.1 hypothetical protein SAMN05660668_00814 [Pseudobutyrivibrio sp. AR14]
MNKKSSLLIYISYIVIYLIYTVASCIRIGKFLDEYIYESMKVDVHNVGSVVAFGVVYNPTKVLLTTIIPFVILTILMTIFTVIFFTRKEKS